MGIRGIIESYEMMEWYSKLVVFASILSLPFVLTYAITSAPFISAINNTTSLVEAPPFPYLLSFLGNLFALATDAYGILSSIS